MIWGYSGVWPGAFGVWKGDQLMNMLNFVADHGFRSTGVGLGMMKEPARRDQVAAFVAEHDLRLSVPAGMKHQVRGNIGLALVPQNDLARC